jgi:hypothetical protein
MQNIVELTPETQFDLLRAIKTAEELGRHLRISTGDGPHGPFIQWAIGAGMWTPPKYLNWVD